MVGYHEGQESYGEYLPNFWRTYDFNVGDVFSYDASLSDYSCSTDYTATVKITEILSNGDTMKFVIKTLYKSNSYPSVPSDGGCDYSSQTHNSIDTIFVINNIKRYENLYGVEYTDTMLSSLNLTYPIMSYWGYNENVNEFIAANHFEHSIFGPTKQIHHLVPYTDSLFKIIEPPTHHHKFYSNHLGTILLSPTTNLGTIYTSELVGAVINGDTLGTIYNFPDDLGFEQTQQQKELHIYPNPATNQINIDGDFNQVLIYNSIGELVLNITESSHAINVSHLPKGLYFVKAFTLNNTIYTTRLIVN